MHSFGGIGFYPLSMLPSSPAAFSDSVSIDGVASLTSSGILQCSNTIIIAAIDSIRCNTIIPLNLSVDCTAAFFSPGGLNYYNFLPIDSVASITLLPGFRYEKTFSIDGISSTDEIAIYFKECILSIDGIAATSESNSFSLGATQTIAGIAAIAESSLGQFYNTITVHGLAQAYADNLYNFLFVTSCYSGINISYEVNSNTSENPTSIGSFSASWTAVYKRTSLHTLNLGHSVTYKKTTGIASDTLNLSQSNTKLHIHFSSSTDTIDFETIQYGFRGPVQSLALTETIVGKRIRSRIITDTLHLTQALTRHIIVKKSVTDTLVFGSQNLNHTELNAFDFTLPNAYVVLLPSKCLVILGVPEQTIILPCPQFDDSQSFQGSLNLKRMMTGKTYTYVRQTKIQKLKYTFNIWSYKYLELRDYLIKYMHKIMTLINWKGETWYVALANNPTTFDNALRWQKKGEMYTVTLEFEGVKI